MGYRNDICITVAEDLNNNILSNPKFKQLIDDLCCEHQTGLDQDQKQYHIYLFSDVSWDTITDETVKKFEQTLEQYRNQCCFVRIGEGSGDEERFGLYNPAETFVYSIRQIRCNNLEFPKYQNPC